MNSVDLSAIKDALGESPPPEPPKPVVVIFKPVGRPRVFGPFPSTKEAGKWAEKKLANLNCLWWTVHIEDYT